MTDRTHRQTNEEFLARLLGGDFLLWSPNIQAEGFLNWDRIFATRTIARGTPKPLARSPIELDVTYEHNGEQSGIDDLMRDEHVSGLLVVKDEEIMLERYAMGLTADRLWQSSSMVKSLTSCLIGAAIHDGLIASVDDPVTHYLEDFAGTAYQDVTIRHLLTMSSGIEWSENTDDLHSDVAENYIKVIAARTKGRITEYLKTRPLAVPPGTQYYYNTADTFLLGLILSKVTGRTVSDYCSEKIWNPMGMEQDGFFMLDGNDGDEVVGSCCGASLRDYARWGLFMLRDGVINGQRILPEGWVSEATSTIAPDFSFNFEGIRGLKTAATTAHAGYGYLWWINWDSSYEALGSYGQWIYVNPAEKVVVVLLGAIPRVPYMSHAEAAAAADSSHLGSPRRSAFIHAAVSALGNS
jgi:CubicO group peptidase (beta-lactamase class C family)